MSTLDTTYNLRKEPLLVPYQISERSTDSRPSSPSTQSLVSYHSCLDYAIDQDPTTASTRSYTLYQNDEPLEILTIGTQNQFNISVSKFIDSNRQPQSRLVVEDPYVNLGDVMQISDEDVIMLSEAGSEELSKWASDHNLVITKVDYLSKQIFRTDAYTLFMCDVDPADRATIEAKIKEVEPFAPDKLEQYTEDAWWDAIETYVQNEPTRYDEVCYKILGALKENKIDLDTAAAVLNYCGAKLHHPEVKVYTGNDSDEHLIHFLENLLQGVFCTEEVLKKWETSTQDSLKETPLKNKIVLYINTAKRLLPLPLNINKLWLTFIEGSMIARPAAGMSHRNRFANAAERISATYVPNIAHPENIHDEPCKNWAEVTIHDQIHLLIESMNPSREAWINFATYMHAQIEDPSLKEQIYNLLLDRTVFYSDFIDSLTQILADSRHHIDSAKFMQLAEPWVINHGNLFDLSPFKNPYL